MSQRTTSDSTISSILSASSLTITGVLSEKNMSLTGSGGVERSEARRGTCLRRRSVAVGVRHY